MSVMQLQHCFISAMKISAGKKTGGRNNLFHRLNMLAIGVTLVRVMYMLFLDAHMAFAWMLWLNLLPAFLFAGIILLTRNNRPAAAMFVAFYIMPLLLMAIGVLARDYNMAFFILMVSLVSFFFIENRRTHLLAFVMGAISFLGIRYFEITQTQPHLHGREQWLVIFNHLVMVALGYWVLSFIRAEIYSYQHKLHEKNQRLHEMNQEMLGQRDQITRQALAMVQQQDSLVESDRLKTQLLSVISHDLRLPLVSVKNMFDVYEKKNISAGQFLEYVPLLNNEINQSLDLLENLLQWSRQQMGGLAVCPDKISLQALSARAVEFYTLASSGKSITINNCIEKDIEALADGQMIKTVLRNLISNAIKFTPDGGLIHLTAEKEGGMVRVHVTDNGTGMTPRQVQHLLGGNDYTTEGTRQEAGSGLGLRLCGEFIRKNGGRLDIKSKPGYGSTFSFCLPAYSAATANSGGGAAAPLQTPVIPLPAGRHVVKHAQKRVNGIAEGILQSNTAAHNG